MKLFLLKPIAYSARNTQIMLTLTVKNESHKKGLFRKICSLLDHIMWLEGARDLIYPSFQWELKLQTDDNKSVLSDQEIEENAKILPLPQSVKNYHDKLILKNNILGKLKELEFWKVDRLGTLPFPTIVRFVKLHRSLLFWKYFFLSIRFYPILCFLSFFLIHIPTY